MGFHPTKPTTAKIPLPKMAKKFKYKYAFPNYLQYKRRRVFGVGSANIKTIKQKKKSRTEKKSVKLAATQILREQC